MLAPLAPVFFDEPALVLESPLFLFDLMLLLEFGEIIQDRAGDGVHELTFTDVGLSPRLLPTSPVGLSLQYHLDLSRALSFD